MQIILLLFSELHVAWIYILLVSRLMVTSWRLKPWSEEQQTGQQSSGSAAPETHAVVQW